MSLQQQHNREPRPQVALPDSPPYTPNSLKGQSASHFGHRNPTSVPTPEASPLISQSSNGDSYIRQSDLKATNGTIGLGLGGFDFPMDGDAEKGERERQPRRPLYASLSRPKAHSSHAPAMPYPHQPAIVSRIPRVPRRFRPALLLATSLLILLIIYASRPSQASINEHLAKNPDLGAFGNGFIKKEEPRLQLIDINDEPPQEIKYTPRPKGPALEWASKEDELLALIGFITGATGNVLPPSVDPAEPIDPSVLLGFDPSGPHAADDLEFLKEEVNALYPLVLFGRLRDHKHAAVSRLLSTWTITPAPIVVDVDMRSDRDRFIPSLQRLLGTEELPQLLMLGRSLGGADDILEMEREELKDLMERTGVITVRKGRKGPKHAVNAEKERNERILKPDVKF